METSPNAAKHLKKKQEEEEGSRAQRSEVRRQQQKKGGAPGWDEAALNRSLLRLEKQKQFV